MKTVVAKFGGTSLADADSFRHAADIVKSDPNRRYAVVSAPGKRHDRDHKITDMLLMCYQLASHQLQFEDVFDIIRGRFEEIKSGLGLTLPLEETLDGICHEIRRGASRDYCASRGEYVSALLLAEHLGWPFVDSAELIRFDADGVLDAPETDRLIKKRLAAVPNAVIPGFYGCGEQGEILTFSRGGSDITGALIARGTDAQLYENWTDVSGFLMADPRVVRDARPIRSVTYKELRELSYMGAQVLHEDAVFPVRQADIPIHIKNTRRPDDPGTLIVPKALEKKDTILTGIAGRKDFCVISVEKDRLREEENFLRKLISVFESNDVPIENMPAGIDSISVIVSQAHIHNKEKKLLEEIGIYCQPDNLAIMPSMALVAVVGHGMSREKGVAARVFGALAGQGINIRMISQGASELNILVGVENRDFEQAVQAIYDAFVQGEEK